MREVHNNIWIEHCVRVCVCVCVRVVGERKSERSACGKRKGALSLRVAGLSEKPLHLLLCVCVCVCVCVCFDYKIMVIML